LSRGFDSFERLDDTADDHLDSLLKTIIAHEQELGAPIETDLITWRGMMTKVRLSNLINLTFIKLIKVHSSWHQFSRIEMGNTLRTRWKRKR
jgi:RAT1-interacting protein